MWQTLPPAEEAAFTAALNCCGVSIKQELARSQVVVRAVVDPEEFRISLDLPQRCRVDSLRVGDDLLDDAAHLESVAMLLIDVDVASGERRLVQMPNQRLLAHRQRREAVGVQLHHSRIVNTFEQVLPLSRRGGSAVRCDERCRLFARWAGAARADGGDEEDESESSESHRVNLA